MALQRVLLTLKVVYDDEETEHPREWDWDAVCDMAENESIEVTEYEDFGEVEQEPERMKAGVEPDEEEETESPIPAEA